MKQADLRELLEGMRKGDEAAFPAVYDMLAKPLYVIAYRITQSREQAEDLTQELFLKLYLSPPDEAVKNPRAWIFRMMHNLAIDAARKQRPEELPEALPDPHDAIGQTLLRTALDSAMETLTPEEREVLSLHLNAELTFQELAGVTGHSLPSVYRCYRRALRKLRAALEEGES
ncbi:MAG: sigma-70 family RNA polymerase sigma factor [Oscillospiraceae bacterium]|nr:sigma-70 family RNA polymerase sigma factor [Oscillospiraceae bacterium]